MGGAMGESDKTPRHRLQLSPGRFAEPAMRDFLKSVTERKDQQVATDPRRFAVVEPPPFTPQILDAERPNVIDLARRTLSANRPAKRYEQVDGATIEPRIRTSRPD